MGPGDDDFDDHDEEGDVIEPVIYDPDEDDEDFPDTLD